MTNRDIKPIALALPRKDEEVVKGRYGSMMPVTPANGFTIIAKVKPGAAETIRSYGAKIEKTIRESPDALAVLRLHYLRWVLFDDDTRFMYIGIFDTDFDKYVEDAVTLFKATGIATIFEQLEGFPADWRQNPGAFAAYCRDHQAPSFMEYAEYPDVSALEVVKSLQVRQSLSETLDQMQ
jgi:hypothetical protein